MGCFEKILNEKLNFGFYDVSNNCKIKLIEIIKNYQFFYTYDVY